MKRKTTYRVIFTNQQQSVYEIYARTLIHREVAGFVIVEDLVFGETSAVVVDPGQERLKTEFQGVKRIYVPLHSIVRIDQVEKEGVAKIMSLNKESNISSFPGFRKSPEELT